MRGSNMYKKATQPNMHLHVYLLGYLEPQDKGRPIIFFSKININFYFPQPLRTP